MNKRRKMLPAFFVTLLFIFVSIFSSFSFADNAEAAINKQINYQGKLTTSAGIAVPNLSISIVFSLYTAPSGGVAIWTETQSVTPSDGIFSVMLGENTALTSVDFNQTLYLGVKVGTDSEMTPRKKLGVVPAAIEAENAQTAQTAQSATKATNLAGGNSSTLLGSIPYQSDTDTTSFVSPNVTLTKKFFTMTGTGTNGATPLWEALVAGDVGLGNVTNENKATMFTSPTFTGTVAGFTTGGDISLGTHTFTTSNNGLISNLNADLLDGQQGSYYQPLLTNPITGTGTDHYLAKFNGTNAIENSLVFDNGTNVGIGTTTPSSKLDVAGNININTNGNNALFSTYKGVNSNGGNVWIGGGGQSSVGILGATENGSYNTSLGTNASLTVTTAKYSTAVGAFSLYNITTGEYNIGVGLNAGKNIVGNTPNTTSYQSIYLGSETVASANGNSNEIVIGHTAVGNGSNSVTLGNTSITKTILNGNVGIGTTSPGAKLDVAGELMLSTDNARLRLQRTTGNNFIDFNSSNGLIFRSIALNDTGVNERMRIDSNGNVGIGTADPAGYKLNVNGTGNFDGVLRVSRSGVPSEYIDISAENGTKSITSQYTLSINTGSNQNLTLNPGSGNVIIPTGSVGIGTTAPRQKLEIVGDVALTTSAAIGGYYKQGVGAVNDYLGMGYFNVAASNDWYPTAGVPALVIKSTGNVGIGTTGPTVSLHVKDASYNRFTMRVQSAAANNANGYGGIGFSGEDENTKGGIFFQSLGTNYSKGNMIFALNNATDQTNATPSNAVMTLTPAGNVGIGTTTPQYKAHIIGGSSLPLATTGASGAILRVANDVFTGIDLGSSAATGIGWIQARRTNADSTYYDLGLNPLGGNVGIGTTSPGYLLEVNGTAKANYLTDGYVTWGAAQFNRTSGFIEFQFTPTDINTGVRMFGNTSYPVVFQGTTGNVGIGYSDPGTAKLAIDGNVGIGTTAPGTALEVVQGAIDNSDGVAKFINTMTVDGSTNFLEVGKAAAIGHSALYGYRYDATVGDEAAVIGVWGDDITSGTGLYVRKGGNVGIGTTTPAQLLDIGQTTTDGTSKDALIRTSGRTSGGGTRSWDFGTATPNLSFYIKDTQMSDPALSIAYGTGNVGIGTTGPHTTLEIAGIQPTGTGGFPVYGMKWGNLNVHSTDAYTTQKGGRISFSGEGGDTYTPSIFGVIEGYKQNASNNNVGGGLDFYTNYNPNGQLYNRMRINDEGNVGIGTTTPGNILTIQQTSATDPVADAWTVYSSGRWKEHRVPIVNALETINELNPVYFDWKAEYGGAHDLGFIAEEVGVIIPEVVAWEDNGIDAKSIDYARLSTIAIAGVKEMNLNLGAITGIIIPTPGSQEEIFANNFFENLFARVGAWLGEAENGIEKIFVREVNTGTLCISDATGAKTCINKAQLDDLMASVGFSSPLGGDAGGGDDGDVPPSVDDNLAKAKTDASTLTVENYTSESWGIFTTALATALELLETNDGEKIIKTTALNDAVAGLEILVVEEVVTDLTEYDVVVDAKTETDYTLESWTTYMDIVNANVVTIVNSQTEVDTATSNITVAQVSLISK